MAPLGRLIPSIFFAWVALVMADIELDGSASLGNGASAGTGASFPQGRFLAPRVDSPRQFPRTPSFSAKITEHPQTFTEISGTGAASGLFHNMTFAYDADRQISKLAWTQKGFSFLEPKFAILPNLVFWTPSGGSYIANYGAICLNTGTELHTMALRNLWEQLAMGRGTFEREAHVNGQACEQWRLSNASWGNISMCVGADGVPRALTVEAGANVVGISNVGVSSHNMTFHDILIGSASTAAELQLESCPEPKYEACSGNGTSELQVLRFSNGETWGRIEDRDTLDWDAFPITATEFAPYHKYMLVFNVEVNSSWGPWRECDYNSKTHKNKCTEHEAGASSLVSRVSAEALMGGPGDFVGQCGANEGVGSWYIFPHQGQCGDGKAIGDEGCTWRVKDWKVLSVETVVGILKSNFSYDATSPPAWHGVTGKESLPLPDFLRLAKAAVAMTPAVIASGTA